MRTCLAVAESQPQAAAAVLRAAYCVLVLVYLVAFITAIYELRPSIRIDKGMKFKPLTKAYPKVLRGLREDASAAWRPRVGRGERASTAGRDKRGMARLNPLEEYSFPPSNLSCDVVAPALLRTPPEVSRPTHLLT